MSCASLLRQRQRPWRRSPAPVDVGLDESVIVSLSRATRVRHNVLESVLQLAHPLSRRRYLDALTGFQLFSVRQRLRFAYRRRSRVRLVYRHRTPASRSARLKSTAIFSGRSSRRSSARRVTPSGIRLAQHTGDAAAGHRRSLRVAVPGRNRIGRPQLHNCASGVSGVRPIAPNTCCARSATGPYLQRWMPPHPDDRAA